MSIFKKILPFFGFKKSDEPVQEIKQEMVTPSEKESLPADNVISIYSHGFTNGVYKIEPDKDAFERFLEYSNELDNIKEQRFQNDKLINELGQKLLGEIGGHQTATDTVIEKKKLAQGLDLSIAEIAQIKSAKAQKENVLIAQLNSTKPEYSWVPALLYLLAGIVFIVADVSITKQITSWGFDMKGLEGLIFAIGLAFTAFLIKPLVDRMLEKSFHKAGQALNTVYKWVLLGITLLGLVMLLLLGMFRSDSQIAQNKIRDLSAQMNELPDPASTPYHTLQNQRDKINDDLAKNNWGQNGLVLSGIIFAIGGAICLSISFPALSHLINRYWILPLRIKRTNKSILMIDRKITAVRMEWTTVTSEQEKAEQRLMAIDLIALKEELKQLEEQRTRLATEFYKIQYEKERNLYQDGKNKGEKYRIEGDLLYKVIESDPSHPYPGKDKLIDGQEGRQRSPRSYTRRPFVKMRKMIADNYNKNQNNHTQDGTEFEIIA